jgi:hypothetical protein
VALQGTLETFALPDVLRLLASTKKTGAYRLDGDRGTGSLWLQEGQIVGGEFKGSATTDANEVAFELLRFTDGDFLFDADATPDSAGDPVDVEKVLAEAEGLLDEWKSIERVVPSLDRWVALRAELPADEVTIRADKWVSVVAIGGGKTVGQLGTLLGLGELPVSRVVKDLVELGLVELGDVPANVAPPPAAAPTAEPAAESAPSPGEVFLRETELVIDVSDELGTKDASVLEFSSTTAEPDPFEPFDPNGLVIGERRGAGADSEPFASLGEAEPEPEPLPEPEPAEASPNDAAEIARQLANLSPKAAKAVAAAAKATTQEEREAALAEVDESEDPINRDLLLKFLGSVNS